MMIVIRRRDRTHQRRKEKILDEIDRTEKEASRSLYTIDSFDQKSKKSLNPKIVFIVLR